MAFVKIVTKDVHKDICVLYVLFGKASLFRYGLNSQLLPAYIVGHAIISYPNSTWLDRTFRQNLQRTFTYIYLSISPLNWDAALQAGWEAS